MTEEVKGVEEKKVEESKNLPLNLYVSREEAQSVYRAIYPKAPDYIPFENFQEWFKKVNFDQNIDRQLAGAHRQLFDQESFVISSDEEKGVKTPTRVFMPRDENISLGVEDFFRNGLAFYRAYLTILQCAGTAPIDSDKKLLETFCHEMQSIRKPVLANKKIMLEKATLQSAIGTLKAFNGKLAERLSNEPDLGDVKQMQKALNLVRGYQLKMTHTERQCTVMEQKNQKGKTTKTLVFSDPATFSSASEGAWKDYDTQEWYTKLKSKLGNSRWIDTFFLYNIYKIKELSPVPMMRGAPNPANASDNTVAVFDAEGELLQTFHSSRVAITEPYEAGKSKKELTEFNHKQLMTDERIKALVTNHAQRWSSLYSQVETKNVVKIPYLHQTLVGDTVRTFGIPGGDASKSSSMIDSKTLANAALREYLHGREIYVKVGKDKLVDVKIFDFKNNNKNNVEGYQKVEFDVLETNNCVNMHHKRSRVRDNDVEHSRQLLQYARQQIVEIGGFTGNSNLASVIQGHRDVILSFLDSSNYSFFTPYKSRGKAVKESAAALSEALSEYGRVSDKDQAKDMQMVARRLNLVMQSAIELKCLVHETWAGALRRKASNLLLRAPYIGRPVKWLLVDVPALVVKGVSSIMPWGMIGLGKWAKHHTTRRKTVYKSAYEGLLAGELGVLQFGCMSNEDRAGEVAALERAMGTEFATSRKLIGYNDKPKDKKEFLKTHGSTQDAQNFAKYTTNSPGLKWKELVAMKSQSGLILESMGKEALKTNNQIKDLRKGDFSKPKKLGFFERLRSMAPQKEITPHQSVTPEKKR